VPETSGVSLPTDHPAVRRYAAPPDEGPEVDLPRGDVTEGVVRVGDTVRRPHQPQSLAVATYLDHLERVGFAGAPRYLGRDDAGRDVLTFLPGDVPGDPAEAWAADEDLLVSVGELLRRPARGLGGGSWSRPVSRRRQGRSGGATSCRCRSRCPTRRRSSCRTAT
jgi:hypothetical protein